LLKQGEIDCAIMAEPFPDSGLTVRPLYDEPFVVAVPRGHQLESAANVSPDELKLQTMLLLGSGHCFRDHVIGVCPELSRFSQAADGIQKTFEGSSLETIRHMVASGVGITVLPRTSVPDLHPKNDLLAYVPFAEPVPDRRVVLAWRKSFTRLPAMDALCRAIAACDLPGVRRLDAALAEAA
jgi:LysR family hydrogen peroxide-inducible transcriptional activator